MIDIIDNESVVEVLSLERVKQHLRVTTTTDDGYIEGLIKAAREKCEQVTGRSIAAHDFTLLNDSNEGETELLYPTVDDVEKVEYFNGSDYVELESTAYTVTGLKEKYVTTSSTYTNIKITYTTTASDNDDLKRLMMDLIQVWYDNRPDAGDLQQGIINRMAKYKIWRVL
jgi:uncharacterized phiE125 gp8 family phage protein